jgi:glycosyltransferase involved in cell wall biosynthesis
MFNTGGGITDTVGGAGIKITENTPEGVAKLLDHLYQNPEILEKVRMRGYENAEHYRVSASQQRLLTLSKELIGS